MDEKDSLNKKNNRSAHRPRIVSFDRLRVIGCILVLLIHVSAQWTDTAAGQGRAALYVALGCNMLGFSSLPLFVMLSGALYFSPDHEEKSKSPRRMTRRSLHFVLLYFIWKLFYLLEDCVLEPQNLAAEGFKKHVILALFQMPGKYHLWYLPMLAVLLFLTPLLYPGVSGGSGSSKRFPFASAAGQVSDQPGGSVGNKSDQPKTSAGMESGQSNSPAHAVRRAYLVPFTILAVLLPTAFQFEFPFKYLLMDFRNLFDLSYFIGYLGYFILGYELWVIASNSGGSSGDQKKVLVKIWILTGLAFLTWILGLNHAVHRTMASGETFYGFSTPFALHSMLLAASLFLLFTNRETKRDKSDLPADHQEGIGPLISRASFGIYLFHPFILDLLTRAGIVSAMTNLFYGIPALLAMVFAGSLLLSVLFLRIPLLRKLIT